MTDLIEQLRLASYIKPISEADLHLVADGIERLQTQLTETRDLAEHWAILAEQRRVELGECRKDAERYGWVVLNADPIELYGDHPIDYETSADPEYKRQFDAAIDRAMEAKP